MGSLETMPIVRRVAMTGSAVAWMLSAGMSAATAQNFVVGCVGSLTGPAASFDKSVVEGVEAGRLDERCVDDAGVVEHGVETASEHDGRSDHLTDALGFNKVDGHCGGQRPRVAHERRGTSLTDAAAAARHERAVALECRHRLFPSAPTEYPKRSSSKPDRFARTTATEGEHRCQAMTSASKARTHGGR